MRYGKMEPGQRYGRLVALRPVQRDKWHNRYWEFRCDCGRLTVAQAAGARYGNTKSCGCLQRDVARERQTTHGGYGTPEHRAWQAIIQRCFNKNNPNYAGYGGRGVTVCDRWRVFPNFLADVGLRPSPGLTLDRVNNNGNYEPGNVRWATRREQQLNRRKPQMLGGLATTRYAVAMLSFGS